MAAGLPYQWLIIIIVIIILIFCIIIFLLFEQRRLINVNKQLEPKLKKQLETELKKDLEAEIRKQVEAEIKKDLEAELKKDMLTNADSRRQGTSDLTKAFAEYQAEGVNPAIAMFDIDDLKYINDTYGHEMGDQVLTETAVAVYKAIRTTDKLIRWGGDEFVGIFYGGANCTAEIFIDKIRRAVSSLEISAGDAPINLNVSIGISYFEKSDSDFSDAIKRADQAMYKAKAEKRKNNEEE